jgi:hypothetical protein
MRFDKSVKSFVRILNMVNGVYPAGSCGGHEKPRGSQIRFGCFYVIMDIRNQHFFNELKQLILQWSELSGMEYNPLYETWCLGGTLEVKDDVFEPWVNEYLKRTGDYKPEDRWDVFLQPSGKFVRIAENGVLTENI